MIRVVLPLHLQTLASCEREVLLDVSEPVTQRSVLDALEARYPMLCGTVREHGGQKRRPRVRFYADGKDLSHEPEDSELPDAVTSGTAPFMIVGALSGG